jgi:hypothetical protein
LGSTWEFRVILVFQSEAGTEIKKAAKYRVEPPGTMMGLKNASQKKWSVDRLAD